MDGGTLEIGRGWRWRLEAGGRHEEDGGDVVEVVITTVVAGGGGHTYGAAVYSRAWI